MAENSSNIKRDYRKLSIPFWVLLIFSLSTISGLVVFVTHNQNIKAIQTSIHLANTVIANNKLSVRATAVDYAFWDEAVENMVYNVDPVWADENVGGYFFDNFGFSTTYVLGANNKLFTAR